MSDTTGEQLPVAVVGAGPVGLITALGLARYGGQVVAASYVLACDCGRSRIRDQLGIKVDGETLAERYMPVEVRVPVGARPLPWRLAWVLRGWAGDELSRGYETEQAPVAPVVRGRWPRLRGRTCHGKLAK